MRGIKEEEVNRKEMLEIFESSNESKVTRLRSEDTKRAANKAIRVILKELPEEAHTIEAMKYVVSEIDQAIQEARIIL